MCLIAMTWLARGFEQNRAHWWTAKAISGRVFWAKMLSLPITDQEFHISVKAGVSRSGCKVSVTGVSCFLCLEDDVSKPTRSLVMESMRPIWVIEILMLLSGWMWHLTCTPRKSSMSPSSLRSNLSSLRSWMSLSIIVLSSWAKMQQ
jgi:hypothetical protein